jgi:hypothetical protein
LRASILEARDNEPDAEALLRRAVAAAEAAGGPPSRLAIDLQLELARHLVLRGQADAARALVVPALVAARAAGGTASVDAALIQSEMGALALYVGAGRSDLGQMLDELERDHDAVLAQGARASSLQRAWADTYAAEAALARGQPVRAQELAGRAAPVLLPVVRDGRARLLLLEVLGRAAVLTGQPGAERAVAAWLDLAQRRFPREAWRARLAAAERSVDLAHWDEADAQLDALAADAPAPRPDEPESTLASPRIDAERMRALLDRGEPRRAFALAVDPHAAADATGRAEALCAAGNAREGMALLDAQARAAAGWRYPSSPEIAREQAVRGLCALAAGDARGAADFARRARTTFAGQPGVSPALKRPLERLEGRLG